MDVRVMSAVAPDTHSGKTYPSHGSVALAVRFARGECSAGDVVQERRTPRILVLPRRSAHAIQVTGRAHPGSESGTCFPGRVPLGRSSSL